MESSEAHHLADHEDAGAELLVDRVEVEDAHREEEPRGGHADGAGHAELEVRLLRLLRRVRRRDVQEYDARHEQRQRHQIQHVCEVETPMLSDLEHDAVLRAHQLHSHHAISTDPFFLSTHTTVHYYIRKMA